MPGICPRCNKNVYFAEEKKALSKSWHKMCFKCAECGKLMDSTNVTQREEEIFCKTCYGRNFGPKGYGFGGGSAGVLSMDDGSKYKNGPPTSNVPQTAQAYVAPSMNAARPVSSGIKPKFGGADLCRRCGKAVYIAEKMLGGGGIYHKTCFSCNGCKKRLESTNVTEHEGQIYCKSCYGRNFGPKGYGYGVGAGTLQTEAK